MILDRLRTETRALHDLVESEAGLPATREEHVQFLAMMLGFVGAWETRLHDTLDPELRPVYGGRWKAARLAEDLRVCGLSRERIRALPTCRALPCLEGVPRMLGSMYVLEGSTLGGQVIARHLEARLGFREGHGYSYFVCYGTEAGERWRAFRRVLVEHSGPETDPLMIEAARETFQSLYDWLRHTLRTPGAGDS
jgi:heme oxygenase